MTGEGRQALVWLLGTLPGSYVNGYNPRFYVTVALDPDLLPDTPLLNEVESYGSQVEIPNNYPNYDSDIQLAQAPNLDLWVTKDFGQWQNVTPGTSI